MSRMVAALAAALAAGAAGAGAAQEFRGAELSVEALRFGGDDADGDDDLLDAVNYRASAEAGLFGGFGVAADLSFYDADGLDEARNLTVHALYDALAFATVGAFYARDSLDEGNADTFGVEAGRSFGAFGVEGFAGFVNDEEDEDGGLFGASAAFDVTPAFSLTADAAAFDFDGGGIGRLGVGGEFRFGSGPALYAEVGRLGLEDEASGVEDAQTYVGVGARIGLGRDRGTTFEPRGLLEVFPGF